MTVQRLTQPANEAPKFQNSLDYRGIKTYRDAARQCRGGGKDMRELLFAAALWLNTGGAASAPSQVHLAADPADVAAIEDLGKQVSAKTCSADLDVNEAIAKRIDESSAQDDVKSRTGLIVALCAIYEGNLDAAYRYVSRASKYDAAINQVWLLKFGLELQRATYDDAVTSLIKIMQQRPILFQNLQPGWIYQLSRDLKTSKLESSREKLDRALLDGNFAPVGEVAPLDPFHRDYAEILATRGDMKAARAQLGSLVAPFSIAYASLAPATRPLYAADPDVRAAALHCLDIARQAMVANPDRLNPAIEAAQVLRLLGRFQEAVQLMQPYKARLERGDKFVDQDRANWWWDGLGAGLAGLGDYTMMVDAYRRGAALDEGGSLNVSQVINQADMQVALNHPADALETLKAFDDPKRQGNRYGDMQMRTVRGCARFLVGDKVGAAEDLAYVDSHEKDAPNGAVELHLCRGEQDAAAAVAIRWLHADAGPVTALSTLSTYASPPAALAKDPMHLGEDKLAQRPDVKAAIDRFGGIRTFNILPSSF